MQKRRKRAQKASSRVRKRISGFVRRALSQDSVSVFQRQNGELRRGKDRALQSFDKDSRPLRETEGFFPAGVLGKGIIVRSSQSRYRHRSFAGMTATRFSTMSPQFPEESGLRQVSFFSSGTIGQHSRMLLQVRADRTISPTLSPPSPRKRAGNPVTVGASLKLTAVTGGSFHRGLGIGISIRLLTIESRIAPRRAPSEEIPFSSRSLSASIYEHM